LLDDAKEYNLVTCERGDVRQHKKEEKLKETEGEAFPRKLNEHNEDVDFPGGCKIGEIKIIKIVKLI